MPLEGDAEGVAFGFGAKIDARAVHAGNVVHDCKSQARTVAWRAWHPVEAIEKVGALLGRDGHAVVIDLHRHGLAVDARHAHVDRSTRLAVTNGVFDEIAEHFLE